MSKRIENMDSLKSLCLWYARRTPSVSTDEKNVFRALVNCWGYSAGPVNGDPLDVELELVIRRIIDKMSVQELTAIAKELGYLFEEDPEDEETDFKGILYEILYNIILRHSEREWLDQEG